MPGRTEFGFHPWDENIGQDSSITKVGGGKRQLPNSTYKSQIPLPLQSTFIIPMPKRNANKDPSVNTDALLWRSYREIIKDPEDARNQGLRVFWQKQPNHVVQSKFRHHLRQKLRAAALLEARLKQRHEEEVSQQRDRQQKRAIMEEQSTRRRVAQKGFEGIQKPVLRSPPPDPEVPKEEIERVLQQSNFLRSSGKKTSYDHPSLVDHGPPFGPPLRSKSETLRRWEVKTFV